MAATKNLIGYGTPAQVTCSMSSLASGSTRESAVVQNTSNLYLDYMITLTFSIASGGPVTSALPVVNVYANGVGDDSLWPIIQLSTGAPYTTGAGDASVGALGVPNNLRLIGSFGLQTTTSTVERTFRLGPMSVASGFKGVMPEAFSIFVENQTGLAFSSSTQTTAQYLEQVGVYTTSGN